MAFALAALSSLRLNHILVGQTVDLCDFQSKSRLFTATFNGWHDGNGAPIDAPKVIKSADAKTTMSFTKVVEGDEAPEQITLVKDPDGFGAMFLSVTKGEGEAAKTTLRRIIAYASTATIEASRAARKPAKVEAAPVEQTSEEVTEQVAEAPEVAPEAAPEKPKRSGRKAKAKVEAPAEA